MLFSLEWLLQLCPADRDVARIAASLTDRGLTVDSVEPRGADHVLDVDIPANRPDALGHLGLARELSAGFDVPLAEPPPEPPEAGVSAAKTVRVELVDPRLCPRYTAAIVRDVHVGRSPDWVVRRIEACGLRSVNTVVDASNLVMLELGQPVHFFDLDRLFPALPGLVRIRRARSGEMLRTLDGVERSLRDDMLVIADADCAVALAGVIGGADSEIGPATRHVLVEAAHFDPISVRRTSRRLGVRTDASYRFERGVDPEAPVAAQALAARLLHELAGGTPASGLVDEFPRPPSPPKLTLHRAELQRLLGFEPEARVVQRALEALRLEPEEVGNGAVCVTVPSWRRDLEREADLVEEVARHVGYDRIPTATELFTEPHESTRPSAVEDRARDILAHAGFHEAIGYAMIGDGEDDRFVHRDGPSALSLTNPIAEPLARLRRSVLPGLLRAVDLNLRRGVDDVRLFEIGRVFQASRSGQAAPDEPLRIGLVWAGGGEPVHWSRSPRRSVDLHDVVGAAEQLLFGLRPNSPWTRRPGALPAFHPGRSLHWIAGGDAWVAWGGALHPELQQTLNSEVFLLEVELGAVAAIPVSPVRQRALPRVPAVTRDLSLVLDRAVVYARLIEALETVEAPAPVRFDAHDLYEGEPLPAGSRSLTLRVTLEPLERTLTDEQTERYREGLVAKLWESLGVRLRS